MSMPKLITKLRRDWAVARGVTNGERIRDLRAARAGIDSTLWPSDAAAFDAMIEHRERRQRRILDFIKTTA